jgi:glycine cleavage system H lipoate-binding protein
MKCPFFAETLVKYCRHCTVQKMIVRTSYLPDEKCSSSRYADCATYGLHSPESGTNSPTCPFLKEARVQYCAAAPVRKFVPYTVGRPCRCVGSGFRYCDAYLAFCQRESRPTDRRLPPEAAVRSECVETRGIRVPTWLHYSPNHLWLDPGEDGLCFVGIDALLARVIGKLEQLSFVPMKAVGRPIAFMKVRGADLQIVFPNQLSFCEPHQHLRATPSRATSDPYTFGWLFKGYDPGWRGAQNQSVLRGLIPGRQAASWMNAEVDRISRYWKESSALRAATGRPPEKCDGVLEEGVAQRFSHDQAFALFNEFFSPYRK